MIEVIVGCLIEENGKLLMVCEGNPNNYGLWGFPGGHLELNESLIEGAIRETYEESGYHVKVTGMLPIQEVNTSDKKYILIKFVADVVSYDEEAIFDDIIETKWMSFDEIRNLKNEDLRAYQSNREILEFYLNKKIVPIEYANNVFIRK